MAAKSILDGLNPREDSKSALSGLNPQCGYAISPTIEEIIRECNAAWQEAKQLINARSKKDDDGSDDTYLSLIRSHTELNKTYPAILATMAAGSYDQKAVRKFFKYVQNHPWKTEAEFLDVQSVYSQILYRVTHPRASQTAIKQMRDQTRAALTENEKKTKEQIEAAQKEAEENNKRHAKERLTDLAARVAHDAPILTHDEVRPVVVKYDDSQ